MIHSVQFTYVLDTNVLYPIVVRDIIFWFAHYDMFTIKWSHHIFDEWADVLQGKGVSAAEINKRIAKATAAFPDAMVENYEHLKPAMKAWLKIYANKGFVKQEDIERLGLEVTKNEI